MGGTLEGARKRRETLIKKYGSVEAMRKAMASWGHKGKKTGKGGFYYLKKTGQLDKLQEAARKGGHKSKRGPKKDA